MKITEREKYLLKKIMQYDIERYLIVNSYNHLDGNERAERHINISKTLVEFISLKGYKKYDFDIVLKVHDFLADILTSRMDEVIQFPLDKPIYDLELLISKFFNVIISNINQIEKILVDRG
jgi:hypothetical protein